MYIEYLSIINIFSITFYHITRKINLKNKTIFYIDKTFGCLKFIHEIQAPKKGSPKATVSVKCQTYIPF